MLGMIYSFRWNAAYLGLELVPAKVSQTLSEDELIVQLPHFAGAGLDDAYAAGLRKAGGADEASAEDLLIELEEQLDRFEKHETPVPEDEWRPLVEADALPPGEYWAAVRFAFAHALATEAAGHEPGTIQFEKGDSANLPLDTAIEL